ncbi:MAG: hypothetical protein K940chlam9_01584, partial [Chlamydiae bacterium]|nr:hypothetical protein [Chlamydiota bacterium]
PAVTGDPFSLNLINAGHISFNDVATPENLLLIHNTLKESTEKHNFSLADNTRIEAWYDITLFACFFKKQDPAPVDNTVVIQVDDDTGDIIMAFLNDGSLDDNIIPPLEVSWIRGFINHLRAQPNVEERSSDSTTLTPDALSQFAQFGNKSENCYRYRRGTSERPTCTFISTLDGQTQEIYLWSADSFIRMQTANTFATRDLPSDAKVSFKVENGEITSIQINNEDKTKISPCHEIWIREVLNIIPNSTSLSQEQMPNLSNTVESHISTHGDIKITEHTVTVHGFRLETQKSWIENQCPQNKKKVFEHTIYNLPEFNDQDSITREWKTLRCDNFAAACSALLSPPEYEAKGNGVYFDYSASGHIYADFANASEFLGGWRRDGFVQEEILAVEFAGHLAMLAILTHMAGHMIKPCSTPLDRSDNADIHPFVIPAKRQYQVNDLYGHRLLREPNSAIQDHIEVKTSGEVYFAGIAAKWWNRSDDMIYSEKDLKNHLEFLYLICMEEKRMNPRDPQVHSGRWGCGAFGGNLLVITCLHLLAARMTGVKMFLYDMGNDFVTFCAEQIQDCTTTSAVLTLLKNSQEKSIWKPHVAANAIVNSLNTDARSSMGLRRAPSRVIENTNVPSASDSSEDSFASDSSEDPFTHRPGGPYAFYGYEYEAESDDEDFLSDEGSSADSLETLAFDFKKVGTPKNANVSTIFYGGAASSSDLYGGAADSSEEDLSFEESEDSDDIRRSLYNRSSFAPGRNLYSNDRDPSSEEHTIEDCTNQPSIMITEVVDNLDDLIADHSIANALFILNKAVYHLCRRPPTERYFEKTDKIYSMQREITHNSNVLRFKHGRYSEGEGMFMIEARTAGGKVIHPILFYHMRERYFCWSTKDKASGVGSHIVNIQGEKEFKQGEQVNKIGVMFRNEEPVSIVIDNGDIKTFEPKHKELIATGIRTLCMGVTTYEKPSAWEPGVRIHTPGPAVQFATYEILASLTKQLDKQVKLGTNPSFRVSFQVMGITEDPGIDAGGLSKELISYLGILENIRFLDPKSLETDSDLMLPKMRDIKDLHFPSQMDDPVRKEMVEEQATLAMKNYGKLMMTCYHSEDLRTGEHLSNAFFEGALALTKPEVEGNFNSLNKDKRLKLIYCIYKYQEKFIDPENKTWTPLIEGYFTNNWSPTTLDSLHAKAKQMAEGWFEDVPEKTEEGVKNYILATCKYLIDVDPSIGWEGQLKLIHAFAQGLYAYKLHKDWNDEFHKDPFTTDPQIYKDHIKNFLQKTQGILERGKLANNIHYNGSNSRSIEQRIEWLKEWILDPNTEEKDIRSLLGGWTGSTGFTPQTKLKVVRVTTISGFNFIQFHSCFNSVDFLPQFDADKEIFIAGMVIAASMGGYNRG